MPTLESGLLNRSGMVPAVFLRFDGELHLFDCGRTSFSPRFVHKLRSLYISHLHMDHFSDFDGILANKLKSPDPTLNVFGPVGIIDAVRCRIQSYVWNLAAPRSIVLTIHEISGERMRRRRISVPDDLPGEDLGEVRINEGEIYGTQRYFIRYIELDHGIPSLGYAFIERDRVVVSPEKLAETGIQPGPWVGDLVWMSETGQRRELEVFGKQYSYDDFSHLLQIKPGRRIVYLTDFRLDDATLDRLAEFARGADRLFCESNYADRDADLAFRNYHLTAGQAGRIAGAAKVKELVLFHFSRRYQRKELVAQAKQYFSGTIL